MIIKDEQLLAKFRTVGRCEWCKRWGPRDPHHVFNPGPKFKLIRNEDELQGRWLKAGRRIVVATGSFVYHYRGVTRRAADKPRKVKPKR